MNPPRTNSANVIAILSPQYNYDGSTDLTPFMQSASAIVDRVVACAAQRGIVISPAEQELIERWLSAHMYAQMDMLYQSKSTEGASATFQGQTGMYLESTRYGQTAISLDYSGCLSAISKRQFARVTWLGKPPSQQIPYTERD